MDITMLGDADTAPCYLVRGPDYTLLLDCALDAAPSVAHVPLCDCGGTGGGLGSRTPQLLPYHASTGPFKGRHIPGVVMTNDGDGVDGGGWPLMTNGLVYQLPDFSRIPNVADIDAVLASSHNGLLALPYLSRQSGFRARVLATEPALALARLAMANIAAAAEMPMSAAAAAAAAAAATATAAASSSSSASYQYRDQYQQQYQQEQQQQCSKEADSSPPSTIGGSSGIARVAMQLGVGVAAVLEELHGLLPVGCVEAAEAGRWARAYSYAEARACLARATAVRYGQRVSLAGGGCGGGGGLEVVALASGGTLGGAAWRFIKGGASGFAYAAGCGAATARHPRPLDALGLARADALLLTGLATRPQRSPDRMVDEFCTLAASALASGGCVIVPVELGGIVYDLMPALRAHLDTQPVALPGADSSSNAAAAAAAAAAGGTKNSSKNNHDGTGGGLVSLAGVPIFYVAPGAEASLAHANISGEFLCAPMAARTEVPEWPFPHAQMRRENRLRVFDSASHPDFARALRSPCVIFAGGSLLRSGPAAQFVRAWGSDRRNALLAVEPAACKVGLGGLLAPFQPLAMRAFAVPVDPKLTDAEAAKLAQTLGPDTLLAPVTVAKAISSSCCSRGSSREESGGRDCAVAYTGGAQAQARGLAPNTQLVTLKPGAGGSVSAVLPTPPLRAGLLDPELAASLEQQLRPISMVSDAAAANGAATQKLGVALVRGTVSLRDGCYLIEGKQQQQQQQDSIAPARSSSISTDAALRSAVGGGASSAMNTAEDPVARGDEVPPGGGRFSDGTTLFGTLAVEALVRRLTASGLCCERVETETETTAAYDASSSSSSSGGRGLALRITRATTTATGVTAAAAEAAVVATIYLQPDGTEIEASDASLRALVRDCVVAGLTVF